MNVRLGNRVLTFEVTRPSTWRMMMAGWEIEESWWFGRYSTEKMWYLRLLGFEVSSWKTS